MQSIWKHNIPVRKSPSVTNKSNALCADSKVAAQKSGTHVRGGGCLARMNLVLQGTNRR